MHFNAPPSMHSAPNVLNGTVPASAPCPGCPDKPEKVRMFSDPTLVAWIALAFALGMFLKR